MPATIAADVARILSVLHEERAWFRHGLTDDEIAARAGLPVERVLAACRLARHDGLIERGSLQGRAVCMLTPLGVARARAAATPA